MKLSAMMMFLLTFFAGKIIAVPGFFLRAVETEALAGQALHPRLLAAIVAGGIPLRHAWELLQREQIRSPDHWLGKVVLHRRHRRTLGTSQDCCRVGASPVVESVMSAPLRRRTAAGDRRVFPR